MTGTLQVEESLAVARVIGARLKECYRNAMLAFLVIEELALGWYVEGVALPHDIGVPIEHGWVELDVGDVIDPTLVLMGDREVSYFPLRKYTRSAVQSFWREPLPHMWQDKSRPLTHEEYSGVFLQAYRAIERAQHEEKRR